jgi:molybdate transport system substrate-binding protein
MKILVPLSIILLFVSCNNSKKEIKTDEITIFTAAGANAPVNELCDIFTKEFGILVNRNFASSGTLARQIASGASADVYISANNQWISYLDSATMIAAYDSLVENKLVIICPLKDTDVIFEFTNSFDILSTINNKIAIGDPSYVPVGKYSKQFFDALDWTSQLWDKTLLTKDVISVLNYVEMGECDWGVVYNSTALASENIRIVSAVPEFLYSPVVFYISKLKSENKYSQKLYEFLQSNQAKEVFQKHGFIVE